MDGDIIFMTRKEIATFLGKDPSTISKWVRQGFFPEPAKKISCRSMYWLKSDVLNWLQGIKDSQRGAEA